MPILVGVVGVILLAGIATAALVSPGALGITAARVSDTTSLDGLVAGGLAERDADNDGLSDSLENYVYGTDPANWDTSGLGIPDGWLVQYGFDPLDPLTREARGKAPPASMLPAAYDDGYPLAYTPPLIEYYSYAKPADHRAGVDAPWWRRGEHADPVAPDQTGTGIPTGWLLARHVPLKDVQPDRAPVGSKGNLTIRQAFEHDTDPFALDSDGDGLDDWTEIEVVKTDPSRFSTSGAGIADGWLLRFRLSTVDVHAATQDPDRDGLTNFEEFDLSWRTLAAERNASGPAILYTKGLDPLNWQTAGTGIPDGWYVRYGLSPFGTDVERVIGRASDFVSYRTFAPEGSPELPDITFTVRSAYEYARPDGWNESANGVWWGGTNPVTLDSDGDGLPDPVEIRGWYANVTFDTGPEAKPRPYLATANPLEGDSDGDGLNDLEEYLGRTDCGARDVRTFPPTDPRNRDTAYSGLSDHEKVCGVVVAKEGSSSASYDLAPKGSSPGLDPTRADSASDFMKDGDRFSFWHDRYEQYRVNGRYSYNGNGSAPKTKFSSIHDWMKSYPSLAALSDADRVKALRADSDLDGDGIMNVADADPSGGLLVEKTAPGSPRTRVFFLGGPEIDPTLYRLTEFAAPNARSATDPANPDTDGDGLPDAWEVRYGKFDPAAGGWNLDPGRYDSDGDSVPDNLANNDNDAVTWYAFERRDAENIRTTRTFVFTNELEYLAGTDPNTLSTAGDNVPDGWKAFWGARDIAGTFPSLYNAQDPSIGKVALEAPEIQLALAQSPIAADKPLRGLGNPEKVAGYVRFRDVASCPADPVKLELRPEAGERQPLEDPCEVDAQTLDGAPVKEARIVGAKRLTYADEARFGTNPYLLDTDGDGAPDAYEALFSAREANGIAYPDPARDDRAKDPDADGLDIAEECAADAKGQCTREPPFEIDLHKPDGSLDTVTVGAGTDPTKEKGLDTDGDSIDDGIEVNSQRKPLSPSDVADARTDTDGDGVTDLLELTGYESKNFFRENVRTAPNDVDTDGDGLLDGGNVRLAATSALAREWILRGIAHSPQQNGMVDFLGERTVASGLPVRPDRLDSAVEGVPDGWLAYYSVDPANVNVAPYAVGRPDWWRESVHGVWWWGDAPGQTSAPDDADGDGLHDRNGEDPFPGSNRLNRVSYANVTITDPTKVEAWVKSAPTLKDQRVYAQRVGDGAGDPKTARTAALNTVDPSTGVPVKDMRACVAVLDVVAPTTLDKGVAFNVSGRVVVNERASGLCGAGSGALLEGSATARVPLANRTVLVSLSRPDAAHLVGAGFTDANGRFNLSANITRFQTYPIPAAGLTLLQRTNGTAVNQLTAPIDTGSATAGEPNRLIVWVYNTSATAAPGSPTHAPHLARVLDANRQVVQVSVAATKFGMSDPLPVTVRAGTRIELGVPDVALNGGRIEGTLKLADSSGAPLLDKTVTVRWTGNSTPIERRLATDKDGSVNLTREAFAVGARADAYALTASFASADPNLLPSSTTLSVKVRDPTNVTARADRDAATVGEEVNLVGELRTLPVTLADGTVLPAVPVAQATLVVSLGEAEETVKTDASGRFGARLAVPGSLGAGVQAIEVSFAGTDTRAPTTEEIPLAVKRTASIVGINRLEGPRGSEVTLRGRLVDNEGQGFDGTIEVVSAKAGILARGFAALDGEFTLFVGLAPLDLGTQQLLVVYPGDSSHAPAENITQARVTTQTHVRIEEAPGVVVRGHNFAVRARLLDDEDKPVARQALAGFWRGARLEVLVTDDEGIVTFLVPTNLSERPAPSAMSVEFSPAANSVFQPSASGALVRVVSGVTLTVPAQSVARGPAAIGGRLVSDENLPLAGAALQVLLDGAPLGEARTSRNGTFELLHVFGEGVPLGAHEVSVRYAGTQTVSNATTNGTWHVRSPLTLQLTTVGPFVRGENAVIDGRLSDDRGLAVDGVVRIFLAGRDLGPQRVSAGALRAGFQVPADLPRGETTLRITAPGSDAYDALDKTLPVIVKIRPKVEVELPTLAVRGFAIGGAVTLKDDKGEPLRNTSYAYVVGSDAGAVVAATNTDGKGVIASVAPARGTGTLALTVRGGPDVVAAQYSSTSMRVVGPATPVGYALLVVALLVVLLVAGLVVAALLLRRRQLQEARDILDDAIRDLLAGNEYAGTIFLAYRRFAAHLSRHGFAEKASDTPREFATGVRKALPVGAGPLRALIGLFEEARYSDHAIGSRERDEAVRSLGQVRAELDKLLGEKRKVAA